MCKLLICESITYLYIQDHRKLFQVKRGCEWKSVRGLDDAASTSLTNLLNSNLRVISYRTFT